MLDTVKIAGGARVITPKLPAVLMGFGSVPAKAIDDELEVNGLVVKFQSTTFIFLAADVLFIGWRLKNEVLDALRDKNVLDTGFSDENLIWAASHNHHAPACDSDKPGLGRFDYNFFEQVKTAAIDIISDAVSSKFREATMEHVEAKAEGLVVNRRKRVWSGHPFKRDMRLYPNPTGPKSEAVHLIRFRDQDHKIIAAFWNFGCHTLTHHNRAHISADFPGAVRLKLRQACGAENLPVLFLQGFSGNILPQKYNESWLRRNPADLLNRIFYGPSFGQFTLPKQTFWRNTLADAVVEMVHSDGIRLKPLLDLRTVTFPLNQLLDHVPEKRSVQITQLLLSEELSLLAVTAEVMTEYVSTFKAIFSNTKIIPVSCVDDSFGYLPLNKQVKEGGYETRRFFGPFGLAEASFRTDAEQRFLENVQRLSTRLGSCFLSSPQKRKKDMVISRGSIATDLRHLGIQEGDAVLFKADIFDILVQKPEAITFLINGFRDVVGPKGTIASAAYTRSYPLSSLSEDQVFDDTTPSILGALANTMLKLPTRVRSQHPSASVVAVGAQASELCAEHDADAPPFLPFKTLADMDGWLVLLGCVSTNPGFGSVHWIQHELGLAAQWRKRNTRGNYYMSNGKKKLYRAQETGGCSRGFNKFYADYLEAEKLNTGTIGGSFAIAIRVRDAFEVERRRLRDDPTYGLCSIPTCVKCRTGWGYNKADIPKYYFCRAIEKIGARLPRVK